MPNPNSNNQWLKIGTIVAPQGLKGELRVLPSSDFPERFEQAGKRWLQPPQAAASPQEVELVTGRRLPGKNLYVVKLAGVEDIDRAEELRGYELFVLASDRIPLPEDEYHVSDLIDLEAIDRLTGEAIGKVTNIFQAGNDLLEVQLYDSPDPSNATDRAPKGKKNKKPAKVLIPFVKAIVPVVDLAARRLEIVPPPGLLEIHQS